MIPLKEARSTLAALAETYARSRYHKLRFDDCLDHVQRRRTVLGGPVVSDWHATPPVIFEAIAFLGTACSIVDILTYLAARRAGNSVSCADSEWKASSAIVPRCQPGGTHPTRYDVPEILAIRSRQPWFDELIQFRNAIFHRGWKENHYGFLFKGDTAQEADFPEFNSMLLPDLACLQEGKRPHEWTYDAGRRLDDLIESCDATLTELLTRICVDIWECPLPTPGTIERAEQPNALLFLPCPVLLDRGDCLILPVFNSQIAARIFTGYGERTQELVVRAVRHTMLEDRSRRILLPVTLENLRRPYKVRFYGLVDGKLTLFQELDAEPNMESLGPDIIAMQFPDAQDSVVYVYQARAARPEP